MMKNSTQIILNLTDSDDSALSLAIEKIVNNEVFVPLHPHSKDN